MFVTVTPVAILVTNNRIMLLLQSHQNEFTLNAALQELYGYVVNYNDAVSVCIELGKSPVVFIYI